MLDFELVLVEGGIQTCLLKAAVQVLEAERVSNMSEGLDRILN